jgi:hypothetical protein
MSNLIVRSSNPRSWEDLKQMLLEEARRQDRKYGLIIRRARSGETATRASEGLFGSDFQAWKNQPLLVYKLDLERGGEQLVRGVEIVGTPLISLEKVIATGERAVIFNGMCGAESGLVPVATVAPPLLTSQIELQRIGKKPRKPPILPSPFGH